MANHLTPEELSKELGIDRDEIIRVCVQESIPIYQGKIDKNLFQAHLQATARPRGSVALLRGCFLARVARRASSLGPASSPRPMPARRSAGEPP